MPALRRSHAHVDWKSLRDLIAQGSTLKELSKAFDIPYRTLQDKSYREQWNVAAIHANLPRRTPQQQAALEQAARQVPDLLPEQAQRIKNNFTSALLKASEFYKNADSDLLRKDSRQVLQFIYAASKLLGWNDPKSASGQTPTFNLQLLAQPAQLAVSVAREVVTDSASVAEKPQVADNQGTPAKVQPDSN
jgi:hypothetical protein